MRKYYGITAPVWIFLFTLLLIVLSGGVVGSSPGKSGAIVPFSMLVLGVVLYVVWLRTGEGSEGDSSAMSPASAAPEPAPSGARPASRQAPPEPTAPAASPVPAAAPAPTSTASLTADERALYLDALGADAERSKEELARSLCRLTGIAGADSWKSAPADDLALLGRGIATAALLSPAEGKYRNCAGADPSDAALDALTKKALHQLCIDTLGEDLASLAGTAAYPEEVSESYVRETVAALEAPGALAGLSRLGKPTLVSLAAFLAGPGA